MVDQWDDFVSYGFAPPVSTPPPSPFARPADNASLATDTDFHTVNTGGRESLGENAGGVNINGTGMHLPLKHMSINLLNNMCCGMIGIGGQKFCTKLNVIGRRDCGKASHGKKFEPIDVGIYIAVTKFR